MMSSQEKSRVEELEARIEKLKAKLADRVTRHDTDGKALVAATHKIRVLEEKNAELSREIERYREFHDLAKQELKEASSVRISASPSLLRVLSEIADERKRQDQKWGEQNHKDGTGGPEAEHRAQLAKAACDAAFRNGRATWAHIYIEEVMEALAETEPEKLIMELNQANAVGSAWIEAIRRRAENETRV